MNDGDFRLGIVGCHDVRVERAQEFSDHFGCDAQYDDHLMSHQTTLVALPSNGWADRVANLGTDVCWNGFGILRSEG